MNPGSFDKASLLSNLLGANTGKYAATTKKSDATHSVDSAQRFQAAMQTVRPDVAARDKPRAESNQRPETAQRPEPARSARPEAARSDVREKTAKIARDAGDKAVDRPAGAARAESHSATAQASQADQDKQSDHVDTEASSGGEIVAEDTVVAGEEAVEVEASSGEGAITPDEITLEPVGETPWLVPLVTEPMATAMALPAGAVWLDADADASGQAMLTASSLEHVEAASTTAVLSATETVSGAEEAMLAGVLAGSQNLGVGTGMGSKEAVSMTTALDAGTGWTAEQDGQAFSLVDVEAGGADEATMDAPDALMGTKTAFSKLLDVSLANAGATNDKAALAADAGKLAPTLASAGNPALDVLTRLSETQSSPAARAFVVQTGVPVTVGQPQWGQAVGDKVLWLAAQNVSAAEIRLDPPDLGPMQVKVSVNQDQATVSFTSPHPVVRDALDQQLNRLREMFTEQGLDLVNVDVSDKSFAQQEREKQESGLSSTTATTEEDELQPVAVASALSMRLVDHYA